MGAFDDLIPGAAAPAGAFDDLVPRKAQADGGGSDLLKSLKVGAQKLPGQLTGLLDIPAALTSGDRPISRAADWVGEKTGFQPGKWARDTKFSPGYDASRAAVDETWKPVEAVAADPNTSKADVVRAFADNLPQILKGYGANPMYSVNQVAESVPGMVAGGVLSRGLMTAGRAAGAGTGALEGVAGKWAAPIAGGVGEGAQQAGQVMDEFQGQDQRKAAIAALASGGLDALIAAGGGRVANRLGLETPETAMAKLGDRVGSKSAGAALGAGAKVAGGAVSEGVFQELPQSMQEQAWQNWAEGKPLGEGVLRGGIEGGIAGGIMGAGANVSMPRSSAAAPAPAAGAADPLPADDVVGAAPKVSEAEKALTAAPTPLRPERIAATEGLPTTFSTEAGARLEGRYALVEAGEVQASHDTNLRPNPLFPPELQPRDRTRAASETQIQNIVGRIDPARLGQSADAGTGAPIIGEDGLVESGNARTIALQRVYGANGQKAHEYRTWLRDNAASFGLTPDQVEGMRQPMLVRVRMTPVDRAEFARQANASTVAAMSPLEQARADAARIDSMDDLRPDEQGDFATSRDFIRRFVGRMPPTEQAGMIDAGGRLSASGYARVRNAVLAKAYGDSPVLARMVESMDDNLRNVSRALVMAAPRVAQVRSQVEAGRLHPADLTPDLVAAVSELERIKQRGGSVADALAQRGLEGDKYTPAQRELLRFMDENIRRPRRIAEFIGAYADALEAAGDPNQGNLLGEAAPPTVEQLLQVAERETASQPEPAPAAATSQAPSQAKPAANEPEVDGDWRAFGPETGTLGVPRAEMPQVKVARRQELLDFLQTRGINHTRVELSADSLKPTQAEYSRQKTDSAAHLTDERTDRAAVLVSSDGYVLDGHHRWLARSEQHKPVHAIQFDAPIGRLLDAVMQFPGTTVSRESAGAVAPSPRDLAVQDLKAAVGDLGDFLTRHMRAAIVEEDKPRLMPIMVNLADAAIRVVGSDLRRVMSWVREHLRGNKDKLPGWNRIPATWWREAAEKALASLQDRGQQLGLFTEAEQAQPDLFANAEAQTAQPEVDAVSAAQSAAKAPAVAMIDGRPYDMARDNFAPPHVSTFVPEAQLAEIGDFLGKHKAAADATITDEQRQRAEALLQPALDAAAAVKVKYDQKIIDIAQRTGALGQLLAPLKGLKRGAEKLVIDYDFNVAEMKDLLRSTIVVQTYADAMRIVEEVAREFTVLKVKDKTTTEARAQASGYADMTIFVTMPNGAIGEIQVNVPQMLGAKEGADRQAPGHKLYDIARPLPQRDAVRTEAERLMLGLYEAAFLAAKKPSTPPAEKALQPAAQARNWPSEIGPQPVTLGSPSTLSSDSPSSASLNTPPPAGKTTNSSPENEAQNSQPSGNLSGTFIASPTVESVSQKSDNRPPGGPRDDHSDANDRAGDAGSRPGVARPAEGTGQVAAVPPGDGAGGERAGGDGSAGAPAAGGLGQAAADAGANGRPAQLRAKRGTGSRARRGAAVPAGRDIKPKSGLNYRFTDDDISPPGSWRQRAAWNVEAVELVRKLQAEKRTPTTDEQKVLARFVGWGASDLAQNLFSAKLDKAREAQSNYERAVAAFEKRGNRPMRKDPYGGRYGGGYVEGWHDAMQVLIFADPKLNYYSVSEITREQLDKAAPKKDALAWLALRDRLKKALTPAEWAEAARSTQYGHFTSAGIVRGMWGAAKRLGFKGGLVVEPGAGKGNFPGLMPDDLAANSSYTGIEYDSITGAILGYLFPDELVRVESYVDTKLPRDFFDMGIGNPPFAGLSVLADPEYKAKAFKLHDYFFAKTIDRVRPGGLLMFVTSRYTMDKADDKARKYLAERADLLGAIRLPQTAFKANAGTEVVTDVLFLRKKVPGETFEGGQAWAGITEIKGADGAPLMVSDGKGKPDKPALINEYFAAHPEMVLGQHANTGSMYADKEYTVTAPDGDIEALFAAAVERLPADVMTHLQGSASEAAAVRELDFNPKAKKEGNYYLSDKGVLMQREAGVGQAVLGMTDDEKETAKSFVALRDAVKQAQYDQLNDGDWQASLAALQAAYQAFVDKHGRINQFTMREARVKADVLDEEGNPTGQKEWTVEERPVYPLLNLLRDDPEWTLVAALENINEETGEITPAESLGKRVLNPPVDVQVQTPHDALLTTLNDLGRVDMAEIADRLGVSEADAAASLGTAVYLNPTGNAWETADAYLSGDVGQKLREAEAAAQADRRYERNVEALRAAQPPAKGPSQIDISIGMNWIPASVYERFIKEVAGVNADVLWNNDTRQWSVSFPDKRKKDSRGRVQREASHMTDAATSDWGTPQRHAGELLEHALTGRPINIRMEVPTPDGKSTRNVADQAGIEAANQKLEALKAKFKEWIWADTERSDFLVRTFNEKFNTIAPRTFDGRHMTLPGTSALFTIFDHVKRGAWRIIQSGNTYLAHAVGSGKTFQAVISAMEQKRLGLIKKPMMVVPNHMLQQFAREWQQLYPAARLMVADENAFHKDKRRQFVSRVALSDLDGVIITHSAFKLLDIDPEFRAKIVDEQIDALRAALEVAEEEDPGEGGRKSPRVKQIEKRIETLEQKLKAAQNAASKDQNARFDELGVDMLYVDEAHVFRKLDFGTARQVKGISPEGSDQALDLYIKTRYLEDKHPGRSLVMMSGTPITNTLAELYSVQRYMDRQTLIDRGIEDFDSWAAMFGRERTALEPNAAGKYEPVTRFNTFANVPGLIQMFKRFADVVTADNLAALLGDKRPKVRTGAREIIVTPKTARYRAFQRTLAQRYEISRAWKPTKDEPNNPDPVIAIIGDGRLAAIDMRFMEPRAPNDPQSKLNRMIDDVIAAYKAGADLKYHDKRSGQVEPNKGSTMMVFSDLGFGEGAAAHRGFNARAWFEKRLRDAGVKMSDVAFMGDYKKSSEKQRLFNDMNAGRKRILVGSSKNMGTGVNAQQRLLDMFHLDSPWFPADLEQREGRIVRQGNKNKEVRVRAYAAKGSYDETMWGMLARKSYFIAQALEGDPNMDTIEDVDSMSQFDIAAALVAEDPRVLQLAGLRAEISKMDRLYQAHEDQKRKFRERFRTAEREIAANEGMLPAAKAAAARVVDLSGDNWQATANGEVLTERKAWGQAIKDAARHLASGVERSQKIGEVSGFPVMFRSSRTESAFTWYVGIDTVPMRVLVSDGTEDPVAVAMRAQAAVAEVRRTEYVLRDNIERARAELDALRGRLETPFPMAEMLSAKRREAMALEAEIAADSLDRDWIVSNAETGMFLTVKAHNAESAIDAAVAKLGGTPEAWSAVEAAQRPPEPDAETATAAAAVGMVGPAAGYGTRLSQRTTGGAGGLPLASAQAVAERVQRSMVNLPQVEVLQSPAEAPETLRQFIESRGAMGDAEAALHDGKIYLFAGNLADEARAEHVLAEHEAAHAGLRGLLGRSVEASMRWLYESNPRLRNQAEALIQQGMSLAEAVEEVIVDIPSAQLVKLKGWRRFAQLVRDALRRAGFVRLAVRLDRWLAGHMTEQQQADLMVADLVREARAFVAGKPRAAMNAEADAAEQVRWLEGQAKRRGYSSVDDMIEKDYEGFDGLAAMWRAQNPMAARLSRAATAPTAGTPTPAQRAEEIIQTSASTPKPLDAAARTLTRITGLSRLTAATYGLGARLIERITPETVKAGIVSDYGVPEAVLDRRALLQGKMREELRKSGALLEKLATLTRAESRVAYEWMSGDDTRTADEIMKDLPEESVQVLRQVRTMIDQLSQEAVRLGQLEPEAFERHRFAYLRRSYFKHAQEFTPAQRAQREHAIKILGDQYKGRGMVAKAPMKQVQNIAPDWWKRKLVDGKADTSLKGEKFERLERRAPTGAGTLPLAGVDQNTRPGRLLEIHYWPAGEPRPAKYADWESAGTWEVRDTKGGDLVLWRDFTKDERTKMGEIDEARYAIGKTLQRMIHDVEVGRYLEWLEQNHAKKPGEVFHGTIVEPSERYSATFPPGTWVQVPDTTVPGTSVKRFGKLAGLYLPGPVWNDLRQTMGGPSKPLGEAYHQAQRLWKTSKTALSPAVHTNNVMANFVMADWHDVTAGHVTKALRLILAARTGDGKGLLGRTGNAAGRVAGANDVDAAREILARYEVSGGSLGGWVTAEISREQLAPIVEALQAEVQGAAAATVGGADVGVYAALQHLLHGRFARSFEAAKGSKPVAAALTEGGNLLDLYQAEDDVFRLAAWLRAKEGGASDADAGKVARKSFLDYSINAPWIAALRATALPFVSFSYRAVPMLVQTLANKPHKILKLMVIAGALNALGVAIGGGGGDDDERKLLPEEKAGRVWGLVPKLVRMPWNDAHGSPVYLDIRRWIPVGDVFDVGQGHAALPVPPSLMPGGPMAILGELLLNRSAFTGKPITLETDTGMEKAGKVLDHLWKALMPNILGLPGTYATQGVVDAAKGRTDAFGREQSVPQALASSVGVKLGSYPSDVLQRNLQARAKAQIAEIDDQIRQLKRQRMTNRIDQDEFEDAVRRQQEKKRAVMDDLREKVE